MQKEHPYYKDYLISDAWEVWSKHYKRLIKQKDRKWYLICYLSIDWQHYTKTVSRLVAETYLDNPFNKRTVNHKDWDRHNNNLSNLEWATDSENCKHRFTHLWHKATYFGRFWYEHNCSKEVIQYDKQWNELNRYWSIQEAQRNTWICKVWISWCCRNRKSYNTAWWFIWKFANNG